MDKKTENNLNKQIYGLVARAIEDEFTNPCFQSAEVERSITVRIGINGYGGAPCIEAILHTETGDKRIAYESLIQIPDKLLIRNDVQKFVIDCDITKAWADKLPKNYDVLSKRDKGYERILNLKPDTVVVLVKDGVPVDRELIDKKIEELFPNSKPEEKKTEVIEKPEKVDEKSERNGFPSNIEDYYSDNLDRDTTKDRDTSDVDVEPFGGAFVGGVERDDYDD